MLTLGLYFIQVLWAYNICIEFNPCQFVQKLSLIYLTLYIDRCILLNSLSDGILFIRCDSCRVYTIIGDVLPILYPFY